jgi:ribosomal-protein-alanine N-acetyltransferase
LKIIPLNEEWIPKVAELERNTFSQPWSEQSLRDVFKNPLFSVHLAVEGDVLLGYGGAYYAGDEANVTNIAVAKESRGKGIGTALVKAILKEAEERGAAQAFLEVRVGNAPAIHVYEKCGFTRQGVRRNYYSEPSEDGYVYAIRIGEQE